MKRIASFCITLSLSISMLLSCSTTNPITIDNTTSVTSASQITDADRQAISLLGLPSNLNLTSEQIKKFQDLKTEFDSKIDYTKLEEAVKLIANSFSMNNFNLNILKSQLSSLNIQGEEYYNSEAELIINSYNLLTVDQKTILNNSEQSIFNNSLVNSLLLLKLGLNGSTIDKFTTELNLNSDQYQLLKNLITSSESPDLYFQKKQENIKSAQAEINSELSTGTASVENISKTLENLSLNLSTIQTSELEGLLKMYNILTPSQRKKFGSNISYILGVFGIPL